MAAYLLRRLFQLVPILFGVSLLVFLALYMLPGDAVDSLLAESGATGERLAQLRVEMGLDQPFHVQYAQFLVRALTLDFGRSLATKQRVTEMIAEQFPATIELTLASMLVAIGLGLPLGVLAATRRGTIVDTLAMVVSLIGVSMPSFWLGLVLIFTFSNRLGWFPTSGTGGWQYLVLPAVALGLGGAGVIARVCRSSTLEVLGQDYIRTARSKGLLERVVIVHHALRNSLLSVVTIVGLQFGSLLGGAVVVETVFGRQGIGSMAARAILTQDFPLVQGTVLVASICFVLVNLLVDLSYSILDPRIRYS